MTFRQTSPPLAHNPLILLTLHRRPPPLCASQLSNSGYTKARNWVERTLDIYREAVSSRSSHASQPEFRPVFEEAIGEFQTWLNESTPRNPYGPYKNDQRPRQ
jgi:hypothetical protein